MAQIVNGITASPNSWPSIANIVMKMENGLIRHCGGTLIDNRTVLSAAQLRKIKIINLASSYHKVEIVLFVGFTRQTCL